MSIELSINGVEFDNPLMVAAGVLGTTESSLRRIAEAGAGGVVSKSISLEPKKGNKGPVLVETDYGVLNSMGLPNPGADYFRNELKKLSSLNKPVVCSVFGETAKKACKVIEKLEDLVDVFELNLSCPNVNEDVICSDNDLIEEFVSMASKTTDKPIWAKLSPDINNSVEASEIALKSGADSIVVINTLKGMLIDIDSGRPVLDNGKGGLSGKAIHPVAVENVYEISKNIDSPVIGVGGVTNAEEAIELMMAGAKAIQIGSGLRQELGLFEKISNEISYFLKEKDIKDVEKISGLSHKF